MSEYFKMAWRNIWRNKTRSLMTMAAVFLAVFLSVLMRGFQLGTWHTLLDSVLHSYTGYLQVHAAGYWENKNFDYALDSISSLEEKLEDLSNIKQLVPRLESFTLASSGERTKGVLVAGIDPSKEYPFTDLPSKKVSGEMLLQQDDGAMLSQRLAAFLGLNVGDTLVLIGQGYAGTTAAGKFPVRAIVHLPAPEWDNQMVYLSLQEAQDFFSAPGLVTTVVVDLKRPGKLDATVSNIKKVLGKDYEVMSWKELLFELYQQYLSDVGGGIILLGILYLVIGFVIFGTLMMMVNERQYEFGIMVAVGMRKYRLAYVLTLEIFLILMAGVLIGMAGSVPVVGWYHFHPIRFTGESAKTFEIYGMDPVIPTLWQAGYIFKQGIAVFVLGLLALVWPVFSISGLRPVKALKH